MKRLVERRELLVAVTACTALVAVSAYFIFRSKQKEVPSRQMPVKIDRDALVEVGGVRRPMSDITRSPGIESDRRNPDIVKLFGEVPSQAKDANPAVQSAYEAIQDGKNPERISPVFLPADFVLAQYEEDPEAYLNRHEPGRVFQSAQPGEGVPVLELVGEQQHMINQGESVRLSVKTLPNMPVTFASFDIGTFDNGLASVTVAADDAGVAKASFTGSRGKVGEVNILAASPVATERIHFNVFVIPPTPEER